MKRTKGRQVRVEVVPAPEESCAALELLGILFKEVLQQIPLEQAEALALAYQNGGVINVHLAESLFGPTSKTAFQTSVYKDDPRKKGSKSLTPEPTVALIAIPNGPAGPMN